MQREARCARHEYLCPPPPPVSGLWTASRQRTTALQLRSLISHPMLLRVSYRALIHPPQVHTHTHRLLKCKHQLHLRFDLIKNNVLVFTGNHYDCDTMQTISKLKHEVRRLTVVIVSLICLKQGLVGNFPPPHSSSDERPLQSGDRRESGAAGNDSSSQTSPPQPRRDADAQHRDSAP